MATSTDCSKSVADDNCQDGTLTSNGYNAVRPKHSEVKTSQQPCSRPQLRWRPAPYRRQLA